MSTPLTRDEIFFNICMDTGSIHKGNSKIGRSQVEECMEQYAAQQTAALREELQKKATCENCSTKITALREELEMLRKVVEPYYGKVYEKPHTVVEFIEAEIPGARVCGWFQPVLVAACKYAVHHTSRANEELLRVAAELEAVKKERDEWKYKAETGDISAEVAIDMVKEQRDDAVKLLERFLFWFGSDVTEEGYLFKLEDDINDLKSRLSCGETKPVSPWISVEDRLPEPYIEVYAGSFDEDDEFWQTICWHTGDHWEGSEIEADSLITHWTPELAPPESLTDKK